MATVRPPTACNCAALRQAARFTSRLYDEALAPVGLGINQYSVLANLDRDGPKILQSLADRLVMDRSSLGHLLRPLEVRGLVTIAPSTNDRRQRVISLTAEGAALLAAAQPYWTRAQVEFEQAFGPERATSLRETAVAVTTLRFGGAGVTANGAGA